ncbi:DUF6443 domain-containing protein, partial [Salegentibacter salinarum]|uniref:DUF6443 domain-containing protein n=1 Tax=Salegentibacter salinarum TaxID=447422 RepID=UPI001E65B407
MKHLYVVFLFICALGYGQSTSENYVQTRTYQEPSQLPIGASSPSQVQEEVIYYDGLGRPKQRLSVGAGGNLEDIVTPVAYDAYGRQTRDYLPVALEGQGGAIHSNALGEQATFYDTPKYENTSNPYREKLFEASPLNRVLAQGAPGEDWALGSDHEIGMSYQANSSTDQVRLFQVDFIGGNDQSPELVVTGTYDEGSLYKVVTYDENHDSGKNHSVEEYTDKQGRVILKRAYADEEAQSGVTHDTYYVYDDY